MSMMKEIEKFMTNAEASINYRVVNLGGKNLYVEGIKSIICLGDNEIRFQLKKCMLIIVGNNMKIKYLDKTTCTIVGDIFSVVSQ